MPGDSDLIAIVDTETTGLCPLEHRIWEAALVIYDRRAREICSKGSWQLVLTAAEEEEADPVALKIGGYAERRAPAAELVPPWQFAEEFAASTAGLPLVGANPSFDEERIRRILWRCGLEPGWHYRPICVESLAVGYLHGIEAGHDFLRQSIDPIAEGATKVPWRSQEVAEALGVDRPEEEAHTALGDCLWALRIWQAVFER